MRTLKIAATVILAALLLAAGAAAQAVALAKFTVLNPGFYGEAEKGAYALIGQTVVHGMTDAVLQNAPAIVLRTSDKEQAYELASNALPPAKVAAMLEDSGPDIARFVVSGGDIPVLKGADGFSTDEVNVVKSLLMDGTWDMLPQKPSFPAFMPFTPEWNIGYGPALTKSLWQLRYYAGATNQAFWLTLSATVLFAGMLYLLWLKNRKPFFTTTGILFTINGLLVLALAVALAYYSNPLAEAAAAYAPIKGVASLFSTEYLPLFRTVLLPFRQIFFVTSLTSLAFGLTMFAMGVTRVKAPAASAPEKEPITQKYAMEEPVREKPVRVKPIKAPFANPLPLILPEAYQQEEEPAIAAETPDEAMVEQTKKHIDVVKEKHEAKVNKHKKPRHEKKI